MSLRIIVLGSAAGGAFPQWNCACRNCTRVRARELTPRTQDSVAISTDGRDWFLLNTSPDVARQIEATSSLWPRRDRDSPVKGVVLTNGDLDHVLGLLQLREGHPLSVYATREVRAGLEQNAMLRTLSRFEGQLVWRELELNRELPLLAPDGRETGPTIRAFASPGKLPIHLAQQSASPGDCVGLALRDSAGPADAVAIYASAVASIRPIAHELRGARLVLLDGTFWSETELVDLRLGTATASQMAHAPIGGPNGSLRLKAELGISRALYTHINNTNPILDPASAEHALVREHGWEVASDGLQLEL